MKEQQKDYSTLVPYSAGKTVADLEIIGDLLSTHEGLPRAISQVLARDPIDNLGQDPEAIDPRHIQSATIQQLYARFTQRVEDGLREDNRPIVRALYQDFSEQTSRFLAQSSQYYQRQATEAAPKGLRKVLFFMKPPKQAESIEAVRGLGEVNTIITNGRNNLRQALMASFVAPQENIPEKVRIAQKVLPQLKFIVENLKGTLKHFSPKAFKVNRQANVICNNEKPIIKTNLISTITIHLENLKRLVSENPIINPPEVFKTPLDIILRDLKDDIFPFQINNLIVHFGTIMFAMETVIQDLEQSLDGYKSAKMAEFLKDNKE